ncbi:MAG: RagB/SusD family nutrient uptake outer membrane protein [Chitinophagaceae bacterium]|nr:RagB/SusD family nutrient uptake outer membrane protein [Chitinophagaceae bacterium]
MKNKLFLIILLALIPDLFFVSCNKKLEERPFTVFSTEYFKTPSGFQSGINALYSGLRFLYGPEGAVGLSTVGTDEYTYAEQPRNGAGGTQDYLTLGNYTLDASNGALLTPWNRSFNNINLANGLIEFAPVVPIPDAQKNSMLGEIRFLRALYYLNLVQYFGAVPLDLGSGELKFNQTAFQGFNRLPTDQLLVKNYQAIIDDARFAAENLPDKRPANAFKLSKAAAFHLLAKAYLFRGYSAAAQSTDFQNAYNAAMEIINNQAKYGVALQQNFADIFRVGNDYNSEILFSVERVPGNFGANEVGTPNSIGAGKGVDAHNDFCGDYTAVRAPLNTSTAQPCRTRAIPYGRPIRRFCPTPYTIFTAFADKINDSRYEGTFRTVYKTTSNEGGFTTNMPAGQTSFNIEGPTAVADTAFVLALTNQIADSLNGISPPGPRLKPYRVIAPREFYFSGGSIDPVVTRNMYPSIRKFEDHNNLDANNQGTRPFPVFRLGETYLLAAEAAHRLGNNTEAMNLINVLKQRAAFRPGLSTAEVTNRYNAIRVTSPSQITLDFILDERTREMCGECTRWPDLAVRGKLIERVRMYNSDAAPRIQAHHVLRPIPRSQLDNVNDPDKAKYQNPGY